MENNSEILNELQTISFLLASLEKVNVFKTPDNYFENLSKRIIISALLDDKKNLPVQKVPTGYFDQLSTKVLSKIRGSEDAKEEIRRISPVLSDLKNRDTFTVPAGYFESLEADIPGRIGKKKAKVVSINRNKKWWRYAAAAAVVLTITIGALQFLDNKGTTEDDQITNVSPRMANYINLSFQYKTPEQLQNGIASLSDTDIVAYLEQHGNVLDDDLITKNIDTDELPDAADYLIDDNTLNDFLKMTNAKAQN